MGFFKTRRIEGRRGFDLFGIFKYYVPGASGIFWILIMFMLGGILGNVVTIALNAFAGPEFTIKYGMLLSYPLMFVPVLMFASAASRRNALTESGVALDSNNFGRLHWWGAAIAVSVATVCAAYISEIFTTMLPAMPEWLENALKQMTDGPLWSTLICVSVFAPLFEEWLCRGMVLRGLLQKTSPAVAIIVSALFFAVIHLNPWQAVPAFILGLLFGLVYYKTGSLKLTMLMHCVNNTLSTVLSKIPSFEEAESFMDVMSPAAYWSVFAVCAVVLSAVVAYFILLYPVKEGQKSNCDVIPAKDWSTEEL